MSFAAPVSTPVAGARLRLGIAAAQFNGALVDGLLARVLAVLRAAGVREDRMTVMRVPGSSEVPWAAQRLARPGRCDCVIGLGVLIAGSTAHHVVVGQSVAYALQRVALSSGVPAINGVMVVESMTQAKARCLGRINRGAEFASAALMMAGLRRRSR